MANFSGEALQAIIHQLGNVETTIYSDSWYIDRGLEEDYAAPQEGRAESFANLQSFENASDVDSRVALLPRTRYRRGSTFVTALRLPPARLLEGGILVDANARYWLVGAYWDGQYDMSDVFAHHGYWEMGWDDPDRPDFAELRDAMRRGDRIAIKARGGKGKSYLVIKALGVVKAVDPKGHRVYVDWKLSGLSRRVESHGEFSTIQEPLNPDEDEERIREIFTI